MIYLYNTFIFDPIFNALIWFYDIIPGNDIGLAIIALTLVIRFILYPLTKKSLQSQKALQEIQPKVKEIQEKYKDNKEVMAQKMMQLYKDEKVSPFSSCLPLLIQLPVLLAVYQVFRQGLASQHLENLYSFVPNPGVIDPISFGFFNMAEASVPLAVLAGLAQFWQTKMMVKNRPPQPTGKELPGSHDEKMLATMNKQMTYFMPLLTVIIGITLPAGLTLYWLVSTLFMGVQQVIAFKELRRPEVEYIKNKDNEHTQSN